MKELAIIRTNLGTREQIETELNNEGYRCYEWSDPPGAYYSPHSHQHDECICVIIGKMSFIISGKEYELIPGEKLYLPAGTIHESRNKGEQRVKYLIGEKSDLNQNKR